MGPKESQTVTPSRSAEKLEPEDEAKFLDRKTRSKGVTGITTQPRTRNRPEEQIASIQEKNQVTIEFI